MGRRSRGRGGGGGGDGAHPSQVAPELLDAIRGQLRLLTDEQLRMANGLPDDVLLQVLLSWGFPPVHCADLRRLLREVVTERENPTDDEYAQDSDGYQTDEDDDGDEDEDEEVVDEGPPIVVYPDLPKLLPPTAADRQVRR